MAESLHITNRIDDLTLLDRFLRQATGSLALSPVARMNLKLAVEEAVVNVMLYAYPGETDRDIVISVEHSEQEVCIVIADDGIAFDPTDRPAPDISLPFDKRPVGGLGTFLMKKLMTKVSYRRTGNRNVLTMTKKYSE
ncbi:MAG: ATP-binding protein [Tannerellaceae bacterium]|jgi:anti-sigma regulatory factor (Ser/Thr protein kinase)|nr:ATP-binding protein [Tannerellaceae bacterium]